jgi:hypothetical protein
MVEVTECMTLIVAHTHPPAGGGEENPCGQGLRSPRAETRRGRRDLRLEMTSVERKDSALRILHDADFRHPDVDRPRQLRPA